MFKLAPCLHDAAEEAHHRQAAVLHLLRLHRLHARTLRHTEGAIILGHRGLSPVEVVIPDARLKNRRFQMCLMQWRALSISPHQLGEVEEAAAGVSRVAGAGEYGLRALSGDVTTGSTWYYR